MTDAWLDGYSHLEIEHPSHAIVAAAQVIHYAGPGNGRSLSRWAARHRGTRLSWHFLGCKDGHFIQQRSLAEHARHAGVSDWWHEGRKRGHCNEWTIGIELEGDGTELFPEPQLAGLETLLWGLAKLMPMNLTGHDEIALPAGRKIDPGPLFPWDRFEMFRKYPRVIQYGVS